MLVDNMSYEAKIKTKFGELIIHFGNKAELEKKLVEAKELVKTIEFGAVEFVPPELPKPLAGLEDVYTITPDGSIKLLRFPKTKSDIIRLAVFLSPNPLNLDQIRQITGVENPAAYIKREHFLPQPNNTLTLSVEGKTFVTSKIIPQLRKKEK